MSKGGVTEFRVSKQDCRDLAFAQECVTASAISEAEFKSWVLHVIGTASNELPTYMYDMVDLPKGASFQSGFQDLVRFWPHTDFTDRQLVAVDGIAYRRGRLDNVDYDVAVDRGSALKALETFPEVEQEFRRLFPFIDW